MISDDRIILGLLALVLGFVFATRDRPGWQRFYVFVPIILVCYLVPSLMTTFGLIDVSESNLWPVAKDYFLPAALFLMTLSIDIKGILGLGSKAIVMFLTATVGIVIGGALALWIVAQFEPSIIGSGDTAAWRGLATLAGSWIGGGANQTAMLEVYGYPLEGFAALLAVDIIVAEIWMIFLLYGAGAHERVDRWLGADSSSIARLRDTIADYTASIERVAKANDYVLLFGVTFAIVGLAHLLGGWLGSWFAAVQGEEATLAEERALLSSAEKAMIDISAAQDALGGDSFTGKLAQVIAAVRALLRKIGLVTHYTANDVLRVGIEDIKDAVQNIASLNPLPGKLFGGEPPHYIKPDAIAEEVEGGYGHLCACLRSDRLEC
jgi:uncharacterized membrane protein